MSAGTKGGNFVSKTQELKKNKQTKKKVLTLPPQAAEASLAVDKPTNVF